MDKEKKQIEFLKSLTYTDINEMFNKLNSDNKHLTEQLALKDSDYSDLQNRNIELIEQLAEKEKELSEAIYMLIDCRNIIEQSESTSIGKTYMNVKCVYINRLINKLQPNQLTTNK